MLCPFNFSGPFMQLIPISFHGQSEIILTIFCSHIRPKPKQRQLVSLDNLFLLWATVPRFVGCTWSLIPMLGGLKPLSTPKNSLRCEIFSYTFKLTTCPFHNQYGIIPTIPRSSQSNNQIIDTNILGANPARTSSEILRILYETGSENIPDGFSPLGWRREHWERPT